MSPMLSAKNVQAMRTAWAYLSEAASQGHAEACRILGDMAMDGQGLSEPSDVDAAFWYMRSSALGALSYHRPRRPDGSDSKHEKSMAD